MATRLFICTILALAAAAALITVAVQSTEVKGSEVIASVATEAIGILVTVGFVEILLERDRKRENARIIAWNAINSLDHAVWVWQGGSRRFNPGELNGLIQLIDSADPLPTSTENLLLRLGEYSQHTLQMNAKTIASNTNLTAGLDALARLVHIRDTDPPMAHKEIQKRLSDAVGSLAACLELSILPPSRGQLISDRSPSEARQRYRLYGERVTMARQRRQPFINPPDEVVG